MNREVRLDGIESRGELVVEHAAEAETGVVLLPVSAVLQVATAVRMELAVFLVGPCFQACSPEPDEFPVLDVPYSPVVEQETGDLYLTAVHCFLAAQYFRDGFQ